METKSKPIYILFVALGITSGMIACSSMPGQSESARQLSSSGPSVLNARVEPSTIELNRNLRPTHPAEVTADIKDFRAKVKSAKLKFTEVPLQVPMQKVAGTTWRAELPPQQLKQLAVSGRTINYEAIVVAENENGQVAQSTSPVKIAIKTPEVAPAG